MTCTSVASNKPSKFAVIVESIISTMPNHMLLKYLYFIVG